MKILKESLPYSINLMPDNSRFLRKLFFISFLFIALPGPKALKAQSVDTLIVPPSQGIIVPDSVERIPGKAALYSAVFPGLGQIYNRKYWKLPIVYGGFGTLVYFIDRNNRYYTDLKRGLIDPEYDLIYYDFELTPDQMERGKDLYRRWRDLSIILTVGFYALQIIDATVDAYLFDWDVSEDISFRLEPSSLSLPGPERISHSLGVRACVSF
jgi:hypothetical protein